MPFPQITTALDFAKFDERYGAFAACPGRAEQRLELVDGALGNAEDALRQWLARAEGMRKKLADWVTRGGG